MNVRISAQSQSNNAIRYMQQQSQALAKYQDQLSSSQRIKTPSDDPGNYPAYIRAKADSGRYEAYNQTITSATSDLNAANDALGEANDVLTRAKQIALEGVNGTTDGAGYTALAAEVDSLLERMTAAGNTQLNGQYLFGGTASGAPPFQLTAAAGTTTVTYQGTAERARVLIGPGQTVENRYAGDQVFQQAGGDAFQALIDLRDVLKDPNLTDAGKAAALTPRLAAVDAARDAIGETRAEQSSHLATLEVLKDRTVDLKYAADTRAGDLGSTDYAEAVVRMNEQQVALQATMAVTAKLLSPSLLDFIR